MRKNYFRNPSLGVIAIIISTIGVISGCSLENPSNSSTSQKSSIESSAAGTENISAKTVRVPTISVQSFKGESEDMLGFIYYDGRSYIQAKQFLTTKEKKQIKELLGDYLGKVKANVDEWSAKGDASKEMESDLSGKLYTVKGYSEKFRICAVLDNGTVEFLENLNGITINSAADTFETRLKLTDNLKRIKYLTADEINNGEDPKTFAEQSDITSHDIDELLQEMNNGTLIKKSEVENVKTDPKNSVYLYFEMKDGTEVEVRVDYGKYILYVPLGFDNGYYICVQGSAFDKILKACQ